MGKLTLLALLVGLVLGIFRYWIGFFIIGHALFAALAVTYIGSFFYRSKEALTPRYGLWLALVLVVGEMVGFGLSQPWFDPVGGALRVLEGRTTEGVFGLALMGGVAGKSFLTGADGLFWLFFNLLDLFFLWLFTMFGLNTFVYKERR